MSKVCDKKVYTYYFPFKEKNFLITRHEYTFKKKFNTWNIHSCLMTGKRRIKYKYRKVPERGRDVDTKG